MIRIEKENGWILLTHPHHAKLAGELAKHWKNDQFLPPEPFWPTYLAVATHDDSWTDRDANPELTPEGQPSAFSKELVETYDAFEEIDLESYLGIRGEATELAAKESPLAAILISMHTVNLLTEQADLSTLNDHDREYHAKFIANQRKRQEELKTIVKESEFGPDAVSDKNLQRAFKFLQACDSFSLIACVDFSSPLPLRHLQPKQDGSSTEIICEPLGNHTFRLSPYPLDKKSIEFKVPMKFIPQKKFKLESEFRELYKQAPEELITIQVVA